MTDAGRAELNITDPTAVRALVRGHRVVVGCAAWTDVDGAERSGAAATAVNGTAVRHLALACADSGALLLHVSTDHVFPDDSRESCSEDAPAGPVNAYGRSKLADVVADQHGRPTWSRALARQLAALGRAALAGRTPAGIHHGTADGRTTWYGLARETFRLAGLAPERLRPSARRRSAPCGPPGVRGLGPRRPGPLRTRRPRAMGRPAGRGPRRAPLRRSGRSDAQ
ncbi:SDR family oxidoreductase [Streptomyces sp. NPDC059224]|uniref:SDR family oxidoreductase n=1 Tax=Streptomyces sp. NPDC059224 TaxID=3346775 RepID=UPI0036B5E8DF